MGIDETTSDVENLLGIKVNYYVKVNYNTLKDLVNSIGGESLSTLIKRLYRISGNTAL